MKTQTKIDTAVLMIDLLKQVLELLKEIKAKQEKTETKPTLVDNGFNKKGV